MAYNYDIWHYIWFAPTLIEGESQLIIPCEIGVKSVVPAVKAAIAKELVETHGLSQTRAAEILGLSQSAVSKYTQGVRGHVITIDEVEGTGPIIDRMVNLLLAGKYSRDEFLKNFCAVCALVRKDGLMCPFCQKTEPEIRKQGCESCL